MPRVVVPFNDQPNNLSATIGAQLAGNHTYNVLIKINFMLSQKNLWPTFTIRGTLTEEVSEHVVRSGLQASVDGSQAAVACA